MADNFNHSVGYLVVRNREVLLVRHTYGRARGKLLIPGGYLQEGEMPEQAAVREVWEETGVEAQICSLLAMRFSPADWYAIFRLDYRGGEPRSDQKENSEAAFFGWEEALARDDLTPLSRELLLRFGGGMGELVLDPFCPSYWKPGQWHLYGGKSVASGENFLA